MLGGLHCPPVVFVPHVIAAQRHTNHLLASGGGCRSVELKKKKNVYAYDYREKNGGGCQATRVGTAADAQRGRRRARINRTSVRDEVSFKGASCCGVRRQCQWKSVKKPPTHKRARARSRAQRERE